MRAFVVQAYLPTGGTYMAYHIGRILQEQFGYEAVAVGSQRDAASMFAYSREFPVITSDEMESRVTGRDILVCNPSFSDELYGLKLPCRKLSYVQNVRTFQILDVFFDHYVFVSEWVRRFVNMYYSIEGPVIPAFIHRDIFLNNVPWRDRQPSVLVMQRKHNCAVFTRFNEVYRRLFPGEPPVFEVAPIRPQSELADLFLRHRHFLSLDVMEGFGLPMLEAMSSGCTVVGWDSGGCQEYAHHGWNCLLTRYGGFESLARNLHRVLHDTNLAEELSLRGASTAENYGLTTFDGAWTNYLVDLLPKPRKSHWFRRFVAFARQA